MSNQYMINNNSMVENNHFNHVGMCSREITVNPHYGSTVHFDTIEDCIDFVQYLTTRNISIIDFCCNGRGCKLNRICNKNSTLLKSNYRQFVSNIQNVPTAQNIVHTCDICYENTTTLYTRCFDERHHGCLSCWTRLSSNSCPFCRRRLRDITSL